MDVEWRVRGEKERGRSLWTWGTKERDWEGEVRE